MVNLKHLKSFSLVEVLVASIIIFTVFSIGILTLSNINKYLIQQNIYDYLINENQLKKLVFISSSEAQNSYFTFPNQVTVETTQKNIKLTRYVRASKN